MSLRLAATVLAAATLVAHTLGCAGDGARPPAGDQRPFVPSDVPHGNVNGEDEGLTLIAFTLVREASGLGLYAAVENRAQAPACQAGMTMDFYDGTGQRLTSVGAVLHGRRPYRLPDGTAIACVGAGEVALAGVPGIADFGIEQLHHIAHLFPSFLIDGVVPLDGLAVRELRAQPRAGGHAYSGVLSNGLEVGLNGAKVTVFPVNAVGRPLGMATSSRATELAAGASWAFETGLVRDPGVEAVAFPSASLPN